MTDSSPASSALAASQISAVFPGMRLLVVEDLVALAIQYRTIATRLEVQTVTAGTVAQAKRHIPDGPWHAALVDLNLPDGTGFDVLGLLRKEHPACSVVVITAEDSLDNAVRASEAGAFDFSEKPVEAERLTVTLRNALNASLLAQRVASYQVEAPRQFEQFLGQSAEMQTVYKMIETVAGSNAPVCITGESGTGKELAANAIHARSPRRAKNFVAVNCAAIPKDLIESELFGHGKGAFTGAVSDRQGVFIEADKGTLFLDEIAELDLGVQAKLLRVLQTGEVKRLGEDKTRIVDVRIVCATHRKLQERVRQGEFREDLFYRLYVVPIDLPPLRARGGDVALIAQDMLLKFAQEDGKQFKNFSAEALAALSAHAWPGNVRELLNVIRAVAALYDGQTVELDMLPPNVQQSFPGAHNGAHAASPQAHSGMAQATAASGASAGGTVVNLQAPQAVSQPAPANLADTSGADNDWFSDATDAPAAGTAFSPVSAASPLQPGHSTAGQPARAQAAVAPSALPIYHPSQVRPLDAVEREAVDYALRAFHGNVAKAARALQVNPSTLYRKIQVWTSAPGPAMEVAA